MGRAIDMENAIDKLDSRIKGLEDILNDILKALEDDEEQKKTESKPKKKTKSVMEEQREESAKKNAQGKA